MQFCCVRQIIQSRHKSKWFALVRHDEAMSEKTNSRPGGRSARVQAAVHAAVNALLEEVDRAGLTIPMIAERADVTPSTIYRRWGDLPSLLADVAVARIRTDEPEDTGAAESDLTAWAGTYAEEMATGPGRELIRDVVAGRGEAHTALTCCQFARQQIDRLAERASERGERFPERETVVDRVVAPIIYRILFDDALDREQCRRLVEPLFRAAEASRDH